MIFMVLRQYILCYDKIKYLLCAPTNWCILETGYPASKKMPGGGVEAIPDPSSGV